MFVVVEVPDTSVGAKIWDAMYSVIQGTYLLTIHVNTSMLDGFQHLVAQVGDIYPGRNLRSQRMPNRSGERD